MSKTTSCKENQHNFVQAASKGGVLLFCTKCGETKRIK
jgi:hypothetical protein